MKVKGLSCLGMKLVDQALTTSLGVTHSYVYEVDTASSTVHIVINCTRSIH